MQKKNDSRFSKEFFEWCVSRAFSDFHYKLFCEIFKSEEAEESNVIQLRADVFTKNYVAAYSNAKLILENKKFLFSISCRGSLDFAKFLFTDKTNTISKRQGDFFDSEI